MMRRWSAPMLVAVPWLVGCSYVPEDEAVGAQAVVPWEVCSADAVALGVSPVEPSERSRSMAAAPWGLLFVGDAPPTGREPWVSSGSHGAGTFLLRELVPGPEGSDPMDLTRVGDRVFFSATDPVHGRELFVSDGSPEGTRLVADLWPGEEGSFPEGLTALGGLLYFTAGDPEHGRELWRTDGTQEGTVLVVDLDEGPEDSAPDQLVPEGEGVLDFLAQDRGFSTRLMRLDVRTRHATEVFRVPSERGIQGRPTLVGRRLFFVAGGAHGEPVSLMVTTGGAPPVVLARFDEVRSMVGMRGRLYFAASAHGAGGDLELWTSDGSPQGTRRLRDVRPGREGSGPEQLVVLGSQLFFVADDGVHGMEPWVSDGTEGGTLLYADLVPGEQGSAPRSLTVTQGLLFFGATPDGATYAPWVTNGLPGGAASLDFLVPNAAASDPRGFIRSGWDLFFTATDAQGGRQLHALPFRPEPACGPRAF
ncbi:hypothetical protein LZ198_24700 [Myxococcus sp. K15C18031901]|uniref:ELWxxDGT repeat protein n=1 Tax=Myxococcus dinghuensis TaxID=2906761 RepID=UPI0020A774D2|nr:ELWxxDGT repeat protein [Myxococcus dinghuensis]MCP3102072.1 hypothetical protein [Myxococcus dinghuensis]